MLCLIKDRIYSRKVIANLLDPNLSQLPSSCHYEYRAESLRGWGRKHCRGIARGTYGV